ncbi:hypothetical protein F903_01833 [Acinetobacter sp. NIPH 298]|nr:hypothetical protein F903_01833 [Acinetobacter sp. NIPH 298]MDR7015133.1 hypothetical protein [Prolinoborus sp. 3657]
MQFLSSKDLGHIFKNNIFVSFFILLKLKQYFIFIFCGSN